MKTKFYALIAQDGHVSIMQVLNGASVQEAVQKFSETAFTPKLYFEIKEGDIPRDRTYRDAWRVDRESGTFSHDMDRAKDIHRARIRFKRRKLFRDLDGQWARAFESGDQVKRNEIEALRKKLRDAPAHPDIESAKTAKELRLVNPLAEVNQNRKLWGDEALSHMQWSDKHGQKSKRGGTS